MSKEQTGSAIESAMTIVPVRYVRASIAFYADVLGFDTRFLADDASLGIVMKGPAIGLQLLHCDDSKALEA